LSHNILEHYSAHFTESAASCAKQEIRERERSYVGW